jgi:HEAT repeat protein
MLNRLQRVVVDGIVQVLAPALHHYLIRCAPEQPSRYFDAMQQRVTMAPLSDGETVVGVLITIEDVTARLERERELAAAEAPAAQDAAQASHPATINALTGALADPNWQIRRAAARGLAQSDQPDVLPHLLRVLRHEYNDITILNSALQALALLSTDNIDALGELLDDSDAEIRMYATLALSAGTQRDQRITALLLRALQDPDANVRYHAIEGLGKVGTADATDGLLTIVETRDFFLAFPALDALANIGDARVAPRIVPLLDNELLARPAIDTLGRLGDEEVVLPLVELLNRLDAPAMVVAQALASVYARYERKYREGGHIADLVQVTVSQGGIENLVAALDQANPAELRPLVSVLGWVQGRTVDRALAQLLARPELRREVIQALVRHGPQVTELLIGLLAADDPEVRQAAVVALGQLGDARAVPELTRVMVTDAELLVIAAGALAKIGDRRPFEALLSLLNHPDAAARLAVVSALNSIGHPEMAARVAPLLQAADPHLRESAIRVAGYFGYRECADGLLTACEDPDENVRRAAVVHLPYLDDDRAIPLLQQALRTDTPKVRAAAARAMGQVTGAAPALLEALNDPDAWVRYGAARALGHNSAPDVLNVLVERANSDPAMQVRIACLEALGETGKEAAVAVLARVAGSDDLELARASLRALGQIIHPAAVPPLLEALRAPNPLKRLEAARALGQRRGPATADEVEALRWIAAGDADASVAETAIAALGRLGTSQATAALIALAADPVRRRACVNALARLDDAGAADMATGLDYPQPASRRAIVEALAQMKRPYASELLGRALDHPDAGVRAAACMAFAFLGSRDYERKLVALANLDPDINVQRAAQKALQK